MVMSSLHPQSYDKELFTANVHCPNIAADLLSSAIGDTKTLAVLCSGFSPEVFQEMKIM